MHALTLRAYTPYGHGTLSRNSLGFNGAFRDPISGFYPLGNGYRIFNPALMRFSSPDHNSPFASGGLNTYAYCLGDPINFTDPEGSSPFFKGIGKTIRNIFVPGDIPVEQFSPTRRRLHNEVDTSSKWGQATASVNKALGSNGDNSIPEWKAESYIERSKNAAASSNAQKRQSLSEPSLFFGSALEWGQVGRTALSEGNGEAAGAAVVGLLFNSAGGFASGAGEHADYKTGRALLDPAARQTAIRK